MLSAFDRGVFCPELSPCQAAFNVLLTVDSTLILTVSRSVRVQWHPNFTVVTHGELLPMLTGLGRKGEQAKRPPTDRVLGLGSCYTQTNCGLPHIYLSWNCSATSRVIMCMASSEVTILVCPQSLDWLSCNMSLSSFLIAFRSAK